MALKLKITRAVFDKLSDEFKGEYIEDGDGYKLDVSGIEDTDALKRGKDRANQELKDAKKALKDATDKLSEIEGDDAVKSKDIDKITKSANDKYAKDVGERDATIASLRKNAENREVDRLAREIATEISKSPTLMIPHVRERLAIEWDGDDIRVLPKGSDGKAGGKVDDLKKELRDNKDFSDIIIASKASGGGSAARNDPSTSGRADKSDPPPNLSALDPKSLGERIRARKEAAA